MIRFDSPVGSPQARDLSPWPPGWVDANPWGNWYTDTGGAYHTGADLNCNTPIRDSDANAPIYSIADGTVVYAELNTPWGNNNPIIIIRHVVGDGTTVWSRYAHCASLTVSKGMVVRRGDQIATIGNGGGRWPYHLHFDIAKVDLATNPGDWPGADLAKLKARYWDPLAYIDVHHAASTEPPTTPPVVMVGGPRYRVTAPEGVRVRSQPSIVPPPSTGPIEVVNRSTILAVLAYGTEFDGGLVSADGWISVELRMGGALTINPSRGYISAQYCALVTPPTAHPVLKVSLSPSTIQAGQTATLSWSIEGIAGIWFNDLPTTGIRSEVVRPMTAGDITYRWRILYTDGTSATMTQLLRVTAAPVPTRKKATLGINGLLDMNVVRQAVRDYGLKGLSITFNTDAAVVFRNEFPHLGPIGGRALFYKGRPPSIDEAAGLLNSVMRAGMIAIGVNENDNGFDESPASIKARSEFDREMFSICKGRGGTYAGGGFSAGTPNIVDDAVVDALKTYYAPLYNAGMWFNQHTYATGDHTPGQTWENIRDMIFDESYGDLVWRGTPERIYKVDWTITRWRFYFRRCGFNPEAPSWIYSDETGLDVGSKGGFNGCGVDAAFVQRFARQWVKIQSQPIKIGLKEYPSPFHSGMIFQLGNLTDWESYDARNHLGALRDCDWGQA